MDTTPLQVSTSTQYGTPAVPGFLMEGATVVRSDLLRADHALRVHNAASAVSSDGPTHAK